MTAALACHSLSGGYAGRAVVRDLDLSVAAGQVVALLGPNGAGKTTTLLTLAGILPSLAGVVTVAGAELRPGRPQAAVAAGVVLVPDDRALFAPLTVNDHLRLAARRGGRSTEQVLEWLPGLRARLGVAAGALSGGEQQMLAMARALLRDPKVLLVDEMSMGLAPVVAQQLMGIVRRVADETQAAVVLVEQHVSLVLGIADRAVVLTHGEVALEAPAAELAADRAKLQAAYLGHGPTQDPAAGRRPG